MCALCGEGEARHVVGGLRWWKVRPGDGRCVVLSSPSVWGTEGSRVYTVLTQSGSWVRGTGRRPLLPERRHRHSVRARARHPYHRRRLQVRSHREDSEANAHHPEMDEMRCLLWAQEGLNPYPLCTGFVGCLQAVCSSRRWLLFWERGSRKVWYCCHAFRVLFTQTGERRYIKMHARIFGEIVLIVCAFVF